MRQALIRLEQGPEVRLELFDQEAPGTVANFEKLANSGFYNGLAFQRVVRGFVAQGGCPERNGRGGTDPIPCETKGNPHKHVRGALSMAHFGPGTGSCQFLSVMIRSIIWTAGIRYSAGLRKEWSMSMPCGAERSCRRSASGKAHGKFIHCNS